MNEEKDLNIKDKIIEKTIKIEEIPKINPNTISKIILNDGTILVVEANSMKNKENELKNINDIGVDDNLKTKKEKKLFSYVEWDFPNTKKLFQRNSISELIGQDTNDNNNEKNENNNKRDNSRDSAINRNIKSKNYSFYESKHLSNKKNNNNNSEVEYKNSSCLIKNDNFKEIENNINDGEKKENENNVNNNDNSSNNKNSNK